MTTPEISIVIATYNRENLLLKAVQSILEQTFQDFEIILVDDCSQDNTDAVLQQLVSSDSRIRSFRTPQNSGPGTARNMGILESKGKFIAIMDDDDIALPERLEIQINLMLNNPQIDLVFSPVEWVDEKMQTLGSFPGRAVDGTFPFDPADIFKLLYLESNKISNTTLFFRREIFIEGKNVNGRQRKFSYPAKPHVGEDWFLMMQLSACGVGIMCNSKPLVLVLRAQAHKNLMKNDNYAFQSQRQVLKMIRLWMSAEEITAFDEIHRLAYSNQLTREARARSGFAGIGLGLQALVIAPYNLAVYHLFARLAQNAVAKLTRWVNKK